jgi:hypothetical protein
MKKSKFSEEQIAYALREVEWGDRSPTSVDDAVSEWPPSTSEKSTATWASLGAAPLAPA